MNAHDDSMLRSLDAAAGPLTAEERQRADARLEQIVATTPPTVGRGTSTLTSPAAARRVRRRLVLVPAAALVFALIVGSVVVQGVRNDNAAYASWTAAPAAVTGDDLDAADSACQGALRGLYADIINLDRAELVLAERRGDYVAMLYHTDNPDMSANCLARYPPGSSDVDVIDSGGGGSSGPALKAPPRGFTEGPISGFSRGAIARGEIDESRAFSITNGAVGEEVTGVTIRAGNHTVKASVQNGRYAAWWPGPAFEGGAPEPSGKGGPEPILIYDLTLADGTVVRDAQPFFPF